MERISFKAKAKNGIINVPEKYKALSNSKLRVIIAEDRNKKVKINKIKITNPYKDITDTKKLRVIREISNWQKKVRDEWE